LPNRETIASSQTPAADSKGNERHTNHHREQNGGIGRGQCEALCLTKGPDSRDRQRVDEEGNAQDRGGSRPKYRGLSAAEKSRDPPAIAPTRQLRTQSCAKQKTNETEDDHSSKRDRDSVPLLAERAKT